MVSDKAKVMQVLAAAALAARAELLLVVLSKLHAFRAPAANCDRWT
jgi:hypothetical protein